MGKALPSPSSPEILVLNPVHEGIGAPPASRFPRCSPVEDAVRRLHVPVLHHHRAAHEAQVVRHGCGMGPVGPGGSGARRSRSLLPAPRDTAGNPGYRKGPVLPAPLPGTRRDRREPEENTARTHPPQERPPPAPGQAAPGRVPVPTDPGEAAAALRRYRKRLNGGTSVGRDFRYYRDFRRAEPGPVAPGPPSGGDRGAPRAGTGSEPPPGQERRARPTEHRGHDTGWPRPLPRRLLLPAGPAPGPPHSGGVPRSPSAAGGRHKPGRARSPRGGGSAPAKARGRPGVGASGGFRAPRSVPPARGSH